MDLAGLGDSATRPGQPDNEVFPPAALEDVRTALDFVARHYDAREVALGGLCSAAYHALRAAVAGLPVNRLLMVNPQNFVWDEDQMSSDLPPQRWCATSAGIASACSPRRPGSGCWGVR